MKMTTRKKRLKPQIILSSAYDKKKETFDLFIGQECVWYGFDRKSLNQLLEQCCKHVPHLDDSQTEEEW